MAGCHGCPPPDADHRSDPRFRRVLWLALLANAIMFVVELVASMLSGSVALQADALDFFADAANYGVSLFVLDRSWRARSRTALAKGATMAAFGIWVLATAVYRSYLGIVPDAAAMGVIGALAFSVNVWVAIMLFRYRGGNSNMRSVWLCSRNDAVGNVAVLLAASGVFMTASGWPDVAVAAVIAGLSLTSACQVIGQARVELRGLGTAGATTAT